eukprot:2902279-Prymnesium_polylepis.1
MRRPRAGGHARRGRAPAARPLHQGRNHDPKRLSAPPGQGTRRRDGAPAPPPCIPAHRPAHPRPPPCTSIPAQPPAHPPAPRGVSHGVSGGAAEGGGAQEARARKDSRAFVRTQLGLQPARQPRARVE